MLTANMRGHLRPRPDRSGLALTRRPGQAIVFQTQHGQEITVLVQSISGGRVKLRAIAPPDVRIDRDELLARDRATPEAA